MGFFGSKDLGWFASYVIVMVMLLMDYRAKAVENYSTVEAMESWQAWREAAEDAGRHGSVRRSKPASEEPPSLVLMRGHFPACVGISALLTTCLYVWLMVCVRGVLKPVAIDPRRSGSSDGQDDG